MSSQAQQTARTFNKILAQPKISSKTRTQQDVEEGVKKLRRLILIDGIPSEIARHLSLSYYCLYMYTDIEC